MSDPSSHGGGGGPTVLVSNAEPHFGVAVVQHLRRRGWEALHEPNPHVALYRLGAVRPLWVITGFDEGDLDDFEFLEAVAARAAAAQSPRPKVLVCAHQVALSGLGPATRRLLGIDLVLARPCRLDAIEEALGSLVNADEDEDVVMLGSCVDDPGDRADQGVVLAS